MHRQQHGDRPGHLTALYRLLTGRPEAEAWTDIQRTGEAMLATFSDGYCSALASLRNGQQDPPGKLTEFAIRWMEVTYWPSSLPARLSRNRLERNGQMGQHSHRETDSAVLLVRPCAARADQLATAPHRPVWRLATTRLTKTSASGSCGQRRGVPIGPRPESYAKSEQTCPSRKLTVEWTTGV